MWKFWGIIWIGSSLLLKPALGRHLGVPDLAAGLLSMLIVGLPISAICMAIVARRHIRRRVRYQETLADPAWPISIADNVSHEFVAAYGAALELPSGHFFLDAVGCNMRIQCDFSNKDVLLPVEYVQQIVFDYGDAPPGHDPERLVEIEFERGHLYLPTIYLGIHCGSDAEVVVYPLCFSANDATQAEESYQRLTTALTQIPERKLCPLSGKAFEERMPESAETKALPEQVLARFWPGFKHKTKRRA